MSKRQQDLFPDLADGRNYVSDYPDLVAEWHPVKNGYKLPEDFTYGSGVKLWWQCKEGHEWSTSPLSRTQKKSNCPKCYNSTRSDNTRKATSSLNLATEFPKLCKEWHSAKNKKLPQSFMPRSMDKVWWLCSKGHEWQAVIDSRTAGRGCPYCSGRRASPEHNFGRTFPEIASEWDTTKNKKTPDQYTPHSNQKVWWRCLKGHKYQSQICSRASGAGCPKCTNQSSKNELRILTEMMWIFDDVKHRYKIGGYEIDIYIPQFNVGLEYDGSYWHKNKSAKDLSKQQAVSAKGMQIFRVREKPLPKLNKHDLLVASQKLLEKDTINKILSEIAPNHKKVDEYLLASKFANEDLYREYLSYFPSPLPQSSLQNVSPKLSSEWHPTKNYPLTAANFSYSSGHKAWWLCNAGHEYEAKISHRYAGSGCGYCSGRYATNKNCLAATHPHLASLWHPTKNGALSPENTKAGSGKSIWWVCNFGHKWQATPNNMKRPTRKSLCPQCLEACK